MKARFTKVRTGNALANTHKAVCGLTPPLSYFARQLGAVAASLTFLREINVQLRTKLSAGVVPPSRKTARYKQWRAIYVFFPIQQLF